MLAFTIQLVVFGLLPLVLGMFVIECANKKSRGTVESRTVKAD